MKNTVYDIITARIVSLLEQGTIPWQRPWSVKTGLPRNLVSKKQYRGINVFMLQLMRYESSLWLTYNQAKMLGATIRKGEKACPVVFWKRLEIEEEAGGETKKIPLLRYYNVFNVAQCDGLNTSAEIVPPSIQPAEQIVTRMPQPPEIRHGMARAYYSPDYDFIGLPNQKTFSEEAGYYNTLFHEMIHSTGHEKRLNRSTLKESTGFGSDPYCREELIAEMGAAFLCGHAGIEQTTLNNSAAYLACWLKELKADNTLIVHAAAAAQKAVDFILGTEFDDEETAKE